VAPVANHAINVVSAFVGGLLLLPAVVGQREGGGVRRFLAHPVMAWLGLISYAIYLWQTSILQELNAVGALDVLPVGDFFLLAPLALVLTTAVAAVSYYVVERPILRFKDARRGQGAG
jgi:peptidoglycan/LPS O-acetylase OafA/YrhL